MAAQSPANPFHAEPGATLGQYDRRETMTERGASLDTMMDGETQHTMRSTFRLVVQLILIAVAIWVIATVRDPMLTIR